MTTRRTKLSSKAARALDLRLTNLFELYRCWAISTDDYIARVTAITAPYKPDSNYASREPRHLTDREREELLTHRELFNLYNARNGVEDATDYCREHNIPIRYCPACGPRPTLHSVCFECAGQLPSHQREHAR